MDPKLTMLYLLIGAIIGLSQDNDESLAKIERQLDGSRWCNAVFALLRSLTSASKN